LVPAQGVLSGSERLTRRHLPALGCRPHQLRATRYPGACPGFCWTPPHCRSLLHRRPGHDGWGCGPDL